MNQISPDHPVRRRLFTPDPEEASLDNFTNVLQEEALRVKTEKMRKWNFDFENDTPLNGTIQWTRCENGAIDYVGRARSNDTIEVEVDEDMEVIDADTIGTGEEDCEEKVLLIQKENEMTPDKKNLNAPLLRNEEKSTDCKTGNCSDQSVRRNIF